MPYGSFHFLNSALVYIDDGIILGEPKSKKEVLEIEQNSIGWHFVCEMDQYIAEFWLELGELQNEYIARSDEGIAG